MAQLELAHRPLLKLNKQLKAYPDRQLVRVLSRLFLCSHTQHFHRRPFRGEKEPSTLAFSQSIACASSAVPNKWALRRSHVPSSTQRANQRWEVVRFPHCLPSGMSHHLQPVIATYAIVLNIFRKEACGIPLLRFSGSCGRNCLTISHCSSVTPINFPATIKPRFECFSYLSKLRYNSGIGSWNIY